MPAPKTKTAKLTAMLAPEEMQMLADLAERSGVTMSQAIRTMIREKHAETMGRKKSERRA